MAVDSLLLLSKTVDTLERLWDVFKRLYFVKAVLGPPDLACVAQHSTCGRIIDFQEPV